MSIFDDLESFEACQEMLRWFVQHVDVVNLAALQSAAEEEGL